MIKIFFILFSDGWPQEIQSQLEFNMEEQFIKADKKYTDCKELVKIQNDEQKHPCYLQYHTTFIKKEIKAEEMDYVEYV